MRESLNLNSTAFTSGPAPSRSHGASQSRRGVESDGQDSSVPGNRAAMETKLEQSKRDYRTARVEMKKLRAKLGAMQETMEEAGRFIITRSQAPGGQGSPGGSQRCVCPPPPPPTCVRSAMARVLSLGPLPLLK